jgi:serine/threonine-protein kinase
MTGRDLDRLVEQFERLSALPPAEREVALNDPALAADFRRELAELLAADASNDDPVARTVARGALLLGESVTNGRQLGAWRVVRELGSGGMGTVLLAERADGQFEQRVAIKLLRGFPTADGARRLRQERQILATLDHPNIARLLDGGETAEGQPYLVMEYVAGQLLENWLRDATPDREQRLRLYDELLAAVAHAHARLVIHRDIKPANIIVGADGKPKLLDFGVAKLDEIDAEAQRESTRVYSTGYASPEQCAGRPVTVATDVYSLGVLLRKLFESDLARSNLELRGIIAKATADVPGDRYPTVDALRSDLSRYRTGRPISAAPDTVWYRARKFVGRHRAAVLIAGLVLAGAVGFVVSLGLALEDARRSQLAAESARHEAESQRAVAERVGDFLADVFGNANSARTGGREVTARELLHTAAESVTKDGTLDDATRSRLHERLATAYLELGDVERARALLAPALARRAVLPDRLAAQLDYTEARILGRLRRIDEARASNERARLTLGSDAADPAFATRLVQQAMWIANRSSDPHRTIELASEALALWRADPMRQARVAMLIINSRAMAEILLGRSQEAVDSYREALALLVPGDETVERLEIALNLAGAILNIEQSRDPDARAIAEAIGVLDEVEPVMRRVAAIDNRGRLVRLLRIRADLMTLDGRAEQSLPVLEEALEIDANSVPPGALSGSVRAVRARALLELGRFDAVIAEVKSAQDPLPPPSTELDDNYAELYAVRAAAHCHGRAFELAREDAAAARQIVSLLDLTNAVRLAVDYRLGRLPLECTGATAGPVAVQ